MSAEGQTLDQKSLRYALGKQENADGLACDCVGFANAAGGAILLGIGDGQDEPPAGQRELILRDLEIYRKARISEIHGRIGKEIPRRKIRRELTELVKAGGIGKDGNTRAAVYLWTK